MHRRADRVRLALHVVLAVAVAAAPSIGARLAGAAPLTWDGSDGAGWGDPNNWTPAQLPALADDATFPTVIPGTGATISLSAGSQINNLTFNNSYTLAGGTLSFGANQNISVGAGLTATVSSSLLDGSGASSYLKKQGAGTLVLNGDNGGYNRWMDVFGGVVQLVGPASNNSVPGSYFHVQGGMVQLLGGVTVPGGKTIYLSNAETDADYRFRSVSGDNVWGGTVALHNGAGDKRIGVDAGSSLTITGALTGAADRNLHKIGDGLLVLAGNGSHSGLTRVRAGTLRLDSSNALLSSTLDMNAADPGTLLFGAPAAFTLGGLTGSRNLDMAGKTLSIGNNGQNTTYSGQLSNGTLVKTGAGTLVLGAANTYTGGTTVNGGTISVSGTGVGGAANFSVNALGPGGSSVVVNSGGALTLTNVISNWAGANYVYSGAGTINLISSGGGSYSQLDGSLSGLTGTLNVSGNGYNYLGGATNVSNATVNVTTTGYGLFFQSGASAQFGALTGNGNIKGGASVGNAAISVGSLNTSTTFSGIIGGGTTVLSLAKTGAGTLTLSGANTYSGLTSVNQGVLNIQNNSALGSTAAGTTVASGAQLQLQNNITVSGESLTLNGGTALRNISGDNIWAGPVAINAFSSIAVDSGSLNISGSLTGASRINKDGAGTLILSGDNSAYTYYMDLNAGTLLLTNSNSMIGTGGNRYVHVTSANATLALQGGITIGPNGGGSPIAYLRGSAANDNPILRSISGDNTWNGTVRLYIETGSKNIGVDADSLTLTNVDGTGNLVKVGAGTLILSGANTYSGATSVNAGVLRLRNSSALGGGATTTTVAGGAALELDNNATLSGHPLVLNGSGVGGTGALRSLGGANAWAGSVNLATNTTIGVDAGALTISGPIGGSSNLTKVGAGTLALNGASNFTGNVAVNGGIVKVGHMYAFGAHNTAVTKVVVAPGATVDFNGVWDALYGYTIAGAGVGGAGALVNTGAHIGNGYAQSTNIKLAADATIGGTGNFALLASGYGPTTLDLAGFTLTKAGTNTFTIANATLTPGTIRIAEGTFSQYVRAHDASAVAFTLGNTAGANLALNGYDLAIGSLADGGATGGGVNLGGNRLTVGALGTSTAYAGVITGSGGLTKVGAGTLTLSGASNFTGSVLVNGGVLRVGNSHAFGAYNTAVTKVVVAPGGAVDFNGIIDALYGYTIAGTGVGGAGALVNTGAHIGNGIAQSTNIKLAADATIGGTGNFALLASGYGPTTLDLAGFTLTKAGTNTFTIANATLTPGNIRIAQGTFSQHVRAHDASAVAFTLDNTAGANLALGAYDLAIGSLAGGGPTGGGVNLGANRLTVGALGTSTAYAGVITGSGGLTKVGAGTQTLSGASTYGGGTTVTAGRLLVNNLAGSSGVGTGDVTVGGGTLGGTGFIGLPADASNVTVNSGGRLAPGNSPGILTVYGNVTMNAGSFFDVEINGPAPGAGYDQLVVNGQVNLNDPTLNLIFGYPVGVGESFTIINNDGFADLVNGAFAGLLEGAFLPAGPGSLASSLRITYRGNDGNDVVLTGVPEPGSLVLLALGAGALALLGWRRRRPR